MEEYRPYFAVIHNRLKDLYDAAMKRHASYEKLKDVMFYISTLRDFKRVGGLSTTIENHLCLDINDILLSVRLDGACTDEQRKIYAAMIALKSDFGGGKKKSSRGR